MKPFDIKKALSGDPVLTRQGTPVTQITLFHVGDGVVFGVIDGALQQWNVDGKRFMDRDSSMDLVMAPKIERGYINVRPHEIEGWVATTPLIDNFEAAEERLGKGEVIARVEWEVP